LLLKITNGVIIGVSDKILDTLRDAMPLQQIHQLRSVSLHLLTGAHRAERDFGETHGRVGAVAYPANDFVVTVFVGGVVAEQGEAFVPSVEDEPGDVFFRHFG